MKQPYLSTSRVALYWGGSLFLALMQVTVVSIDSGVHRDSYIT